jgi:hypothetical protein
VVSPRGSHERRAKTRTSAAMNVHARFGSMGSTSSAAVALLGDVRDAVPTTTGSGADAPGSGPNATALSNVAVATRLGTW